MEDGEYRDFFQQVIQQVRVLYADDSSQDARRKANELLTQQFPQHKHWTRVLSEFLSKHESLPEKPLFFAANQLKMKIQNHWYRIPEEDHERLAYTLVEFAERMHRKGPGFFFIETQLCLALAVFLIQKKEWDTAIDRVVMKKWCSPDYQSLLLHYLTIHAEEIIYWRLPYGYQTRRIALTNLQRHSRQVLRMLESLFQLAKEGRSSLLPRVFACFNTWVSLMEDENDELVSGKLEISKCMFEALHREEYFDVAASAIARLLRLQIPIAHKIVAIQGGLLPRQIDSSSLRGSEKNNDDDYYYGGASDEISDQSMLGGFKRARDFLIPKVVNSLRLFVFFLDSCHLHFEGYTSINADNPCMECRRAWESRDDYQKVLFPELSDDSDSSSSSTHPPTMLLPGLIKDKFSLLDCRRLSLTISPELDERINWERFGLFLDMYCTAGEAYVDWVLTARTDAHALKLLQVLEIATVISIKRFHLSESTSESLAGGDRKKRSSDQGSGSGMDSPMDVSHMPLACLAFWDRFFTAFIDDCDYWCRPDPIKRIPPDSTIKPDVSLVEIELCYDFPRCLETKTTTTKKDLDGSRGAAPPSSLSSLSSDYHHSRMSRSGEKEEEGSISDGAYGRMSPWTGPFLQLTLPDLLRCFVYATQLPADYDSLNYEDRMNISHYRTSQVDRLVQLTKLVGDSFLRLTLVNVYAETRRCLYQTMHSLSSFHSGSGGGGGSSSPSVIISDELRMRLVKQFECRMECALWCLCDSQISNSTMHSYWSSYFLYTLFEDYLPPSVKCIIPRLKGAWFGDDRALELIKFLRMFNDDIIKQMKLIFNDEVLARINMNVRPLPRPPGSISLLKMVQNDSDGNDDSDDHRRRRLIEMYESIEMLNRSPEGRKLSYCLFSEVYGLSILRDTLEELPLLNDPSFYVLADLISYQRPGMSTTLWKSSVNCTARFMRSNVCFRKGHHTRGIGLKCIEYIMKSLSNSLTSLDAAQSLEFICQHFAKDVEFFEHVLPTIVIKGRIEGSKVVKTTRSNPDNLPDSDDIYGLGQTLDDSIIGIEEYNYVLNGIVCCLNECLNLDQCSKIIRRLLNTPMIMINRILTEYIMRTKRDGLLLNNDMKQVIDQLNLCLRQIVPIFKSFKNRTESNISLKKREKLAKEMRDLMIRFDSSESHTHSHSSSEMMNRQRNELIKRICSEHKPILLNIFEQIHETLLRILSEFHGMDEALMERTTRVIKHGIRCESNDFFFYFFQSPVISGECDKDSPPLLVRLSQFVCDLYMKSPRSPFIYLISVIIDEFGDKPELHGLFGSMLFDHLTIKTFFLGNNNKQSLDTLGEESETSSSTVSMSGVSGTGVATISSALFNSEQAFENQVEIVEDYFSLIGTYMDRCPALVVLNRLNNIPECYVSSVISSLNSTSYDELFDDSHLENEGGSVIVSGSTTITSSTLHHPSRGRRRRISVKFVDFVFTQCLLGVCIDESRAGEAVCVLLTKMIQRSHRSKKRSDSSLFGGDLEKKDAMCSALENCLRCYGDRLMEKLITAVADGVPFSRVRCLSSVFSEWRRIHKVDFLTELRIALDNLPMVTEDPTKTELFDFFSGSRPPSSAIQHWLGDFHAAAQRFHTREHGFG